jgi:EgtB-related family protein
MESDFTTNPLSGGLVEPPIQPEATGQAINMRFAKSSDLRLALLAIRKRTLTQISQLSEHLGPELTVPFAPTLNPLRWELGHLAWFAERWITRNPQILLGCRADPNVRRPSSMQFNLNHYVDTLFDSSQVPHKRRWHLPLVTTQQVIDDLARSLDGILKALEHAGDTDEELYFFRLILFHEAMHAEAAVYMAKSMGIDLLVEVNECHGEADEASPRGPYQSGQTIAAQTQFCGQYWSLGLVEKGFVFDNELTAHEVWVEPFEIDCEAIKWSAYLPWIEETGRPAPRYLRQTGGGWQILHRSNWVELNLNLPACHINYKDAVSWCAWAKRRLPTEAEWELAMASQHVCKWGSVWEWTSDAFKPYPGFTAHPYRDYSQPWFDGRPLLKGAGPATSAVMRHLKYRNFFAADRDDIHVGFRSVAL